MDLRDLFDLSASLARPLFDRVTYPWQVLPLLGQFILELGPRLGSDYEQIAPNVWIGKGTRMDSSAICQGPAIIGRDCEIRPGAYLRTHVLAGNECVLGHASEFKNCVLFDKVQAPHFNYVGDSVLGRGVHLGAGVIASNFKNGGSKIAVQWDGVQHLTELSKLGVLAGDGADIGSQAVLNPGVVLGRHCVIYPLVSVRGTVPASTIVKSADPSQWVSKRPE